MSDGTSPPRWKRLPWRDASLELLVFLVALGVLNLLLAKVGPGPAHAGGAPARMSVAALLALFLALAVRSSPLPGLVARGGRSFVFTLLFLAAIGFHLLNSYLHFADDAQSTEKRKLAARPAFSLGGMLNYPAAFETYFNDSFSLRSSLIRLNHRLKAELFDVSPVPQKVVLGADGWLFYAAEHELDNYMCKQPLTDAGLNKIREGLLERKRWLEERGIKHYILIVPNKTTVYPEFMPAFIRRCDRSRLDQLVAHLREDFSFRLIDIREDLARAKKDGTLYYRTDTHWNHEGAFQGYVRLMEVIRKDFPAMKTLKRGDLNSTRIQSYSGDLAAMLSLVGTLAEDVTILAPKKIESAVKPDPPAIPGVLMPTVVYEKPASTEPRVVGFIDSFFPPLLPFITESFSRGVFVWSLDFKKEVIETEKPDIVIEEVIERNLDLRFVNLR